MTDTITGHVTAGIPDNDTYAQLNDIVKREPLEGAKFTINGSDYIATRVKTDDLTGFYADRVPFLDPLGAEIVEF